MKSWKLLLGALAAASLVQVAQADAINVFNTGVDANGNVLPDGSIGDLHYQLIQTPGGTSDIRVRSSAGGYPIPPWNADNSLSRWIGPNNNSELQGNPGTYVYRTTFDLTGLNIATASLKFHWSNDDDGQDVKINGVSTFFGAPWADWSNDYLIDFGFVQGLNTLDFVVVNSGGPTGLRVEITGTADAIAHGTPEPATLALFGIGLVGCALRRRKTA